MVKSFHSIPWEFLESSLCLNCRAWETWLFGFGKLEWGVLPLRNSSPSCTAEGHPGGFSNYNLYSFIFFPQSPFSCPEIRNQGGLCPWIGAVQQVFPTFVLILLGTLQCSRRISWRCLALDLLTPSSNPISPLCKPCGFYAPNSLLSPFYCPDGKLKGQEEWCCWKLPDLQLHVINSFLPLQFTPCCLLFLTLFNVSSYSCFPL